MVLLSTVASCAGIISDVQYADIPDGLSFNGVPRYYRSSLVCLRGAVEGWRGAGVDFAIHLGDIIDGFNPPEVQAHCLPWPPTPCISLVLVLRFLHNSDAYVGLCYSIGRQYREIEVHRPWPFNEMCSFRFFSEHCRVLLRMPYMYCYNNCNYCILHE